MQADTIRILVRFFFTSHPRPASTGAKVVVVDSQVWVLSFMAFGYATEEFEVTPERLGVYRPEEHMYVPQLRCMGSADAIVLFQR